MGVRRNFARSSLNLPEKLLCTKHSKYFTRIFDKIKKLLDVRLHHGCPQGGGKWAFPPLEIGIKKQKILENMKSGI